ncbi:MAG: DUF5683 domain-containing protein [Chitinophagaceae bacterium]
MTKIFLIITVAFLLPVLAFTQKTDSLAPANSPVSLRQAKATGVTDSLLHPPHSPRKAAIYSAILPGLGQVYNKKYWKVPIVYAAIGIPVYFLVDNKRWYDKTKYALAVVANGTTDTDSLNAVDPALQSLVRNKATGSLLSYRNDFRRNMDYSILFGLLFWGLNVVDATVDAHLKGFDISEDLSLKIKPTLFHGGQAAGVSFVLTMGKTHPKTLPSSR